MTASESRPESGSAAFWLLVIGAALLMAGGLMAVIVGFDTLRRGAPTSVSDDSIRSYLRLYRGAGVLFGIAAAALARLAMRARHGDPRYRRAATGLGMAIVVLVAVAAVFLGTVTTPALLSLLPIIAGTLLLNRRAPHDV
jgi:peptidoglycan/LPS O-acetylase OafA/YrhL